MNLFFTFTRRVLALLIVLVFSISVSAANRMFATLADMHAATDLEDGDEVTISGDVVFEYCYYYYFVVSDKDGSASCMNSYCYYIGQIIENESLKAGDVLRNYSGVIHISPSGVYRLEPKIETKAGKETFGGSIVIVPTTENYVVKTTKVTVKDLLDNQTLYDGKIVSLDEVTTKNMGASSYLIQGNDTLKGFSISGLNNDAYPSELVIDRALFKVEPSGKGALFMSQQDFDVTYKNVKSLKATGLIENIPIDLTVQVIKKEEYEGKIYLTVYEGVGENLIDYAGLRILLNTENVEDKKIKAGDFINIKTSTATYQKAEKQSIYFKHSLLTLDDHETTILRNESINYNVIYPDNVGMLEVFEFLPVSVYGVVNLTGGENKTHKDHNFVEAVVDEETKIYIDITKKPSNVGNSFMIAGCLEVPMWQDKASRAYIIPLSEQDFTSDLMQFDNIGGVVDYGVHANPAVRYQINSDMTITGINKIDAVGDEDSDQNILFVTDATASIMLRGILPNEYKVGDVITGISGYYSDLRNSQVLEGGARDFGVARCLYLDSIPEALAKGNIPTSIMPKGVTISGLFEDEDLASSVVEISNFTVDSIVEVVQDVTVKSYYIYQDGDSIAIDPSFIDIIDNSSIVAIYYLNGFYTRLLPYTGIIGDVALDYVVDKLLFISDNVLNAQGAKIDVYDIMGRFIVSGFESVAVDRFEKNIFIVRTEYSDGQLFITKIINN